MSIATPTYLVDQNIVPISGDNPGDVLAVALQTASSTATADVSLNWHEE